MTADLTRLENDPGRDALDYRIGTHASFRRSMLAALGTQPALAGLTTRDDDDPVVALADAWSTALDVLAFYSERIAGEGFLRTATERESVLLLARAIGYEVRPGVAATTWLSFTVSETPGAPATVPIPAGTQAQTVPGPGEQPQTFETVQPLTARPALNAVPVQVVAPHPPANGESELRLAGTDLLLQPGDPLLILAGGTSPWYDLRRVRAANVHEAEFVTAGDTVPLVPAYTLVTLDAAIATKALSTQAAARVSGVEVHVLRQRASIFGYNATPWSALPVALRVGELDPTPPPSPSKSQAQLELMAGGSSGGDQKVSQNKDLAMTEGSPTASTPTATLLQGAYATAKDKWADATFATNTKVFFFDQTYPAVVADSWLVLERDGGLVVRWVDKVSEEPHAEFGLAARVTKVTVGGGDIAGFAPRTTTVLCQSQKLTPADWPLPATVSTVDLLDLAHQVGEIEAGRPIAVTGLGVDGTPTSEVVGVLKTSVGPAAGPRLHLDRKLTGTYSRASIRVLGNVAKATHGQSRAEVLGGGDQRVPFQSFPLSQAPLTYVGAATATGTRTTLAIWVDGVRWHEVSTLHGQPPDARVYTVRRSGDGTARVTFGDGRTGARLPTGVDNVVATYRINLGRAGTFGSDRLTIPLSHPLGLMGVTNPVPAAGADDPEPLDAARRNAPFAVRALGRVVSLDDYEDFARAFAGVGKARADLVWDGERQLILLTVAGPGGAEVPEGAALRKDLPGAIDNARHPIARLQLMGYHHKKLKVRARLAVEPDRRFPDVAAAATAALTEHFSFDRRDFAQPVPASEVLAVLQGVPGVVAAVLELLHDAGEAASKQDVVVAHPARRSGNDTLPAHLLTVDAADVELVEVGV